MFSMKSGVAGIIHNCPGFQPARKPGRLVIAFCPLFPALSCHEKCAPLFCVIAFRHEFAHHWFGPAIAQPLRMFPRPVPISQPSTRYAGERNAPRPKTFFDPLAVSRGIIDGLRRRWTRERRRRKVGRAYDMAQEIARVIPRGTEVLDVGCGNGFIAHHLSAMLGASVVGIDLGNIADAPIDYRRYDGAQFPLLDDSVDAVLLCYVLHHAQEVSGMLTEMRRVLRAGGLAVVYEDIPQTRWDKGVCSFHNRQWRGRTGPCTFRHESEWRVLFESFGFEIVSERRLSRWRNLTHPVARRFFVLTVRLSSSEAVEESHRRTRSRNFRHARAAPRWSCTNQPHTRATAVEFPQVVQPVGVPPVP